MKRQLEIQTNHLHLTSAGGPSYHVYDEHRQNVAAFVTQADAELFVSAPDLLAALQTAVAYIEANRPKGKIKDIFSELNYYENAVLKPARAAITKATNPTL
jgi:hypothetical protein